jgi:hypothetical protein
MIPASVKPTADPIDLFVSRLWKRVKGKVANDLYIKNVISDQFAWLVSLENTSEPLQKTCYLPDTSDEWTDADEKFNKQFSASADSPTDTLKNNGVVRKRVCTNILNTKNKVCMRKECTFAHNIAEWSPEMCKYGKKCKTINKCERLHGPCDTKELLAEKLKIVFMEHKKYVKTKMHIKSASHDKKTK